MCHARGEFAMPTILFGTTKVRDCFEILAWIVRKRVVKRVGWVNLAYDRAQ